MKNIFLGALFLLPFVLYALPLSALADNSAIEITNTFPIADKETVDGDILSVTDKGLVRSFASYDSQIFGVLTSTPLGSYRPADNSELPVARNGVAQVNVTILTGKITKGDLITSSEIIGKGEKAVASGYVLGAALESFDGTAGDKITYKGQQYNLGKINVAVKIEYAEISGPRSFKRLFDFLGASLFSSIRSPNQFSQIVRYIGASLIILLALLIALITFSRTIPKAIEAIGRNPLAKNAIYLSIAVSVAVMILIIALGVAAAIVVLRI